MVLAPKVFRKISTLIISILKRNGPDQQQKSRGPRTGPEWINKIMRSADQEKPFWSTDRTGRGPRNFVRSADRTGRGPMKKFLWRTNADRGSLPWPNTFLLRRIFPIKSANTFASRTFFFDPWYYLTFYISIFVRAIAGWYLDIIIQDISKWLSDVNNWTWLKYMLCILFDIGPILSIQQVIRYA